MRSIFLGYFETHEIGTERKIKKETRDIIEHLKKTIQVKETEGEKKERLPLLHARERWLLTSHQVPAATNDSFEGLDMQRIIWRGACQVET